MPAAWQQGQPLHEPLQQLHQRRLMGDDLVNLGTQQRQQQQGQQRQFRWDDLVSLRETPPPAAAAARSAAW
jgi:hypothetical protein